MYRQLSIHRVLFIIKIEEKAKNIYILSGWRMLMITYDPFYRTLKERGVSTYKLINQYNISRSLLDRLKHNKPISTVTIDDLCKILNCRVEDILSFESDE